jgi:hypothetical protein
MFGHHAIVLQLPLAAVRFVPSHARAITVEASSFCGHVSKTFQPLPTMLPRMTPMQRTRAKTYCPDSVLGFCRSFSHATGKIM